MCNSRIEMCMEMGKRLFVMLMVLMFAMSKGLTQDVLNIMPLGNSITFDNNMGDTRPVSIKVAYRYKLYQLLQAGGYNFMFIGSRSSGYHEDLLTTIYARNAGFPGIITEKLADVIETGSSSFTGTESPGPYLQTYNPDIVLLHIGTNDINQFGASAQVTHVERILNAIHNHSQNTGKPILVFLATIVSFKDYPCGSHTNISSFNNKIKTLAQNKINQGHKLILVDMECTAGINYSTEMIDAYHPNVAGYEKMGAKWYSMIDQVNSAPSIVNLTGKTIVQGGSFAPVTLDNHVVDAEDAPSAIDWVVSLENPTKLSASINAQRQLQVTVIDPYWYGSETIRLKATDKGKIVPKLKKSAEIDLVYTVNRNSSPPVITGQKALEVNQRDSIQIKTGDVFFTDPYNPPGSHTLEILPGTNFRLNGSWVVPNPSFHGTLSVPVKVANTASSSSVFNLDLNVKFVNLVPVITGQKLSIRSLRGVPVPIRLEDIEVVDPDNEYPGDFLIQVFPGDHYVAQACSITPTPGYFGELEVPVRVFDGIDWSNTYPFVVDVVPNSSPGLLSPGELTAYIGVGFSLDLVGFDPDDDPVQLTVENLPSWLNFNPVSWQLTGTPGQGDKGSSNFVVVVSDGFDTIQVPVFIQVLQPNRPPVITSTPAASAFTYRVYEYKVIAVEEDEGDVLTYQNEIAPGWLSINSTSGLISGTPQLADTGIHQVKIRVTDGQFNVYQQFCVEVVYKNGPPVVTSTPKKSTLVNQSYTYGFLASDPEGDALVYFADSVPSWLTYISSTKVLIGTPALMNVGINLVTLGVSDGEDTTFFSYEINVLLDLTGIPHIVGQDVLRIPRDQAFSLEPSSIRVVNSLDYPLGFNLVLYAGTNFTFEGHEVIPASGFVGYLKVPYQVTNGMVQSQVDTLLMEVYDPLSVSIGVIQQPNLYPNPTSNWVSISFGDGMSGKSARVSFYTMAGQFVWLQEGWTGEILQVSLKDILPGPGIYLCKIEAGDRVFTRKLDFQP
jgi:hypothetical protein